MGLPFTAVVRKFQSIITHQLVRIFAGLIKTQKKY